MVVKPGHHPTPDETLADAFAAHGPTTQDLRDPGPSRRRVPAVLAGISDQPRTWRFADGPGASPVAELDDQGTGLSQCARMFGRPRRCKTPVAPASHRKSCSSSTKLYRWCRSDKPSRTSRRRQPLSDGLQGRAWPSPRGLRRRVTGQPRGIERAGKPLFAAGPRRSWSSTTRARVIQTGYCARLRDVRPGLVELHPGHWQAIVATGRGCAGLDRGGGGRDQGRASVRVSICTTRMVAGGWACRNSPRSSDTVAEMPEEDRGPGDLGWGYQIFPATSPRRLPPGRIAPCSAHCSPVTDESPGEGVSLSRPKATSTTAGMGLDRGRMGARRFRGTRYFQQEGDQPRLNLVPEGCRGPRTAQGAGRQTSSTS